MPGLRTAERSAREEPAPPARGWRGFPLRAENSGRSDAPGSGGGEGSRPAASPLPGLRPEEDRFRWNSSPLPHPSSPSRLGGPGPRGSSWPPTSPRPRGGPCSSGCGSPARGARPDSSTSFGRPPRSPPGPSSARAAGRGRGSLARPGRLRRAACAARPDSSSVPSRSRSSPRRGGSGPGRSCAGRRAGAD